VLAIVVERDLHIATDRDVAVGVVRARHGELCRREAVDQVDQTPAGCSPLLQRRLEWDAAEVAPAVAVEVEMRSFARRDRLDARLEALALARREVGRDLGCRPFTGLRRLAPASRRIAAAIRSWLAASSSSSEAIIRRLGS
jgi:hypothetical protein